MDDFKTKIYFYKFLINSSDVRCSKKENFVFKYYKNTTIINNSI